ncbi:YjbH domain-containing protein [Sulfitobacter sp. D35]|uniref:YjbH domain-containing protein n=1 Tax=Sulfitobacter sp. D35 TaxID=3083252 RepID=UPI00296FB99E|nr:YjbH domain-containing protein [Sulfitobacter sp. D35]MDW4498214.1 YjbH domain-containing protein [Sulfitobacter sp. D35]
MGTVAACAGAAGSMTYFGARAQEAPYFPVYYVNSQPSLNFYGLPGLVDMPSAFAMPDAQYATTLSYFGGITRGTLSFQFTPFLSGSFRYSRISDFNTGGFENYYDRNFDVRLRVLKEGQYAPELTIGLQDLAGTGISSAEYIVASKSFSVPSVGSGNGSVRVTAGLGWGRLGSAGSIGSTGTRPNVDLSGQGGEFSTDQWFRGDFAPFAGVEWQVNDRIGLKAEYSSDAYFRETERRDVFDKDSRFNFGAEYQVTDALRVGAYYLYGSEVGVSAQWQINPRKRLTPLRVPAPAPVPQRPSRSSNPELWSTEWSTSEKAPGFLAKQMDPLLRNEGLRLDSLTVSGTQAELRFLNLRYESISNALGRAARVMAATMPPSVETFRLVPVSDGLALSAVVIQRSALEQYEFAPNAAGALLASTAFDEAAPSLQDAYTPEDTYPNFTWSLAPYLATSYFDPDKPFRADVGLALRGKFRPARGWVLAGQLRHRLFGDIADAEANSDSVLPRVRTDATLYARASDTYIEDLYASYQWKMSEDVYARVSAGYLESMFGGISGEVLWKKEESPLAIGVEANYVAQREFDRHFGFQDYDVATGHVSAYYEMGEGYIGQVDVGRYLAGDYGATFTLTREFANGWKIGGFFTLTDVSAEDFGEGSFDKGINLTIPLSWFTGTPSTRSAEQTIRPVQRDGGQRLDVPGRLYEQVRSGHRNAVTDEWSRVWN